MQRRYVRHWSEKVWKKPRNTLRSFACFFQAFAAQLIAEIHSSYLTDSGNTFGFTNTDLKQKKEECSRFGKSRRTAPSLREPSLLANLADRIPTTASTFLTTAYNDYNFLFSA